MATMMPSDIGEFETEGERTFYKFLEGVAKPDAHYLCWYLPEVNGKEPDFLLYSDEVGLIIFEVKCQDPKIITKSGLMVGLGETRDEVMEVMRDLREAKCNLLTIGQYLRPSPKHQPVVTFVLPEEFLDYKRIGKDMGFAEVASSPFVRSSYRASELYPY